MKTKKQLKEQVAKLERKLNVETDDANVREGRLLEVENELRAVTAEKTRLLQQIDDVYVPRISEVETRLSDALSELSRATEENARMRDALAARDADAGAQAPPEYVLITESDGGRQNAYAYPSRGTATSGKKRITREDDELRTSVLKLKPGV